MNSTQYHVVSAFAVAARLTPVAACVVGAAAAAAAAAAAVQTSVDDRWDEDRVNCVLTSLLTAARSGLPKDTEIKEEVRWCCSVLLWACVCLRDCAFVCCGAPSLAWSVVARHSTAVLLTHSARACVGRECPRTLTLPLWCLCLTKCGS